MSLADFHLQLTGSHPAPPQAIIAGGGHRNLQLLSAILEDCGCVVRYADTDSETFRIVREDNPDILLIDPELRGEIQAAEVCRVIKSDPLLQATQIIMVNETHSREEVTASILAGADGCITLTLAPDDIKTRILPGLRNRAIYRQLQQANEQFQKIFVELRALNREKDNYLKEGSVFQTSLLPSPQELSKSLRPLGLQVSMFQTPFPGAEVSGDFWDLYELGDGSVGFLFADAVGHGIRAAFYSMYTLSALRRIIQPGHAGFLAQHSEELFRIMDGTHLAAGYCRITKDSVFFSNAGMPAPLVIHNGRAKVHELYGPILGGFPTSPEYAETELALGPGDYLLLVSDGILEAKNAAGEEFGTERLVQAAESAQPGAEAMNMAVIGSLMHFLGDEPFGDDASMVIFQRAEADPKVADSTLERAEAAAAS